MSRASTFHEKYKPKFIATNNKNTRKVTKHKEMESGSFNSHDTNYPFLWHFLLITFDEINHPTV
jgi:hypothetical protein